MTQIRDANIISKIVKGFSRLFTVNFWRNYGAHVGVKLPWVIAFVMAVTFAPLVMGGLHQEWMRLVLSTMLVLLFILSIVMAIFFLYEIGTDEDLQ